MGTTALRRQVITDATGKPIAVIVPIEEYEAMASAAQVSDAPTEDPRDAAIARAAHDRRFMADLADTMEAFKHTDVEWWEPRR